MSKFKVNKRTLKNFTKGQSDLNLKTVQGGESCQYLTRVEDVTCDRTWGGPCAPSQFTCDNSSQCNTPSNYPV
jgi:hypothetical protein